MDTKQSSPHQPRQRWLHFRQTLAEMFSSQSDPRDFDKYGFHPCGDHL
jgi:hypothetical protein